MRDLTKSDDFMKALSLALSTPSIADRLKTRKDMKIFVDGFASGYVLALESKKLSLEMREN